MGAADGVVSARWSPVGPGPGLELCGGRPVGSSAARLEAIVGDLGGAPFVEAALPPMVVPLIDGAAGAGLDRLVERLMINLPWTIRLSLDFLRSRVSISISHISMHCPGLVSQRSCEIPSAPISRSMTDPIRTLITPRNP